MGQPFEKFTDYASLQFFISQPKLSRWQTCWLESLADFQPTFIYKRDKFHAALDALSRLPALNLANKIGNQQALHEAVLLAQQNSHDSDFLNVKRSAIQANSGFTLKDRVVVKLVGNHQSIVLAVDASQLKETVLNELHTSSLGGHLGYRKLLILVNAYFWWPYMPSAVQ